MKTGAFNEIRKNFGVYSSFALWDENDIGNFNIIKQNVNLLHGKVIFVAYNAADPIGEFQNFHHRHKGGRDVWLASCIGKDPYLKGSYMTDFFKGAIAKKVQGVIINEEIVKSNRKALEDEILLFCDDKPVLVAIGRDAEKIIKSCGFSCEYIPHYSGRITRKEFESKIRELSSKLQN